MNKKRLYKSSRNKKICGVCGGIAEYLNMDPTVIRLITAIIALAWVLESSYTLLWLL